ncbi:hypothetical protein [Streptomyces bacillaris]|uniref:hypothetical protein n=1 Tax=Streptomyces bacillaris TaxID=68179 RepID=UPI003EBD1B6E
MSGTTANRLMSVIEAAAAAVLGVMAVALAASGNMLSVLFAFGSLTFVWDWWRRSRKGSLSRTDYSP